METNIQSIAAPEPVIVKALSIPVPCAIFAEAGSFETQRAWAKANMRSPGRAIREDLWKFADHKEDMQKELQRRRAAHRQAVIQSMINLE